METPEKENHAHHTLTEHLVELRIRVVYALYGLVLGMGISITQSEKLMDFMREPIKPYLPSGGLVFTAVLEKFLAHLKVSLLAGAILTAPWWLYQVWCFIAPGLYRKERRYAVTFLLSGTLLFLVGAAFAYKLVFPPAFKYLLGFGGTTDVPMITIGEYISFFVTTTLVFGAAFELPLVLVTLGMLGVIDSDTLKKNRRYAVVGLAVVSAVVTPPDALSMLMLLAPLVFLYEISIWLLVFFQKKRGNSL